MTDYKCNGNIFSHMSFFSIHTLLVSSDIKWLCGQWQDIEPAGPDLYVPNELIKIENENWWTKLAH